MERFFSGSFFSIIVFFILLKIGMASVCSLEQCEKKYQQGSEVDPRFHVIAQRADGSSGLVVRLLQDINLETGVYSFLFAGETGVVDGWEYKSLKRTKNSQLIELEYLDSSMKFSYLVEGNRITPLSSEITNVGYMLTAMVPALILSFSLKFLLGRALRARVELGGMEEEKL